MSKGLGGRLEEGERDYYRRVEGMLEGEDEEEEVFLRNVVDQVLSDGPLRVCCDKVASRVVEQILHSPTLKGEELLRLTNTLTENYCMLAMDRCGSHVAESVVKVVANNLGESSIREPILLSLCSTLRERLSELIVHPYGSHVVSSLLQVLAGIQLGEDTCRSRYSREFRKAKMGQGVGGRNGGAQRKVAVPESHLKLLDRFGKRVSKLPELAELLVHESASPVLQVLLKLLRQRLPSRGEKLIRKILRCPDLLVAPTEDKSPPAIFRDVVGSHLMQCVFEVASPQLHQHIYDTCFGHNVMTFALHPIANYPLQQLIATASPEQVSMLVGELSPLEDVLFVGHSGVVVRLVDRVATCCPDQQPSLLQALLTAFHTQSSPRSCAPLFLSLTAYEIHHGEAEKRKEEEKGVEKDEIHHGEGKEEKGVVKELTINTTGSLLVQSLLKFQDPKLIVSSLLHMTTDDIIKMSCDPSGSHVVETFMESTTVPMKRKISLLERIWPCLVPLCSDRHGSRVMDAVWRNCEVGRKETLAHELLAHEEELSSNFFGKIVLRNCNVSHYKRKQAVWKEEERGVAKRREMFQDILGGEETEVQQQRKRKAPSVASLGVKAGKREGDRLFKKRKIPLFESDNEEKP